MKQLQPMERARLLARLFTRPIMAAIAKEGTASPTFRLFGSRGLKLNVSNRPAGRVFDDCFEELSATYRCEYVYKQLLADKIVFGRHSPKTASMHVELPVGRSIVDVAVFNGTSTAYEIKTEYDSDKRLVSQSSDYLKVFDRVYVVTHPTLVERIRTTVDEKVGILALTSRNCFSEVQPATSGTDRLDPAAIFRMLRRDEFVAAANQIYGQQPDLPNGSIFAHYENLFKQLPAEQIHQVFVDAFRLRTTDPQTVEYLARLPRSLRALGYATPLSGAQRKKMLNAIA